MNKKILNYIIFITIALVLLYFARNNYRDFNINKAISACVLAKKQNTTNFDKDLDKNTLKVFDVKNSMNAKKSHGGTSVINVKSMIKKYKREI